MYRPSAQEKEELEEIAVELTGDVKHLLAKHDLIATTRAVGAIRARDPGPCRPDAPAPLSE
jgi:hypothetical protein